MKAYVIGAGGGGSWLVPSLAMLIGNDSVIVLDRDRLESKNLNRQLFTEADLETNKARALGEKYGCEYRELFYTFGLINHRTDDWIFCCADNNPCRKAVLRSCDMFGCKSIIAGNEKHSAEAYFYRKDWKGTKLDPRIYYPEIENDASDDPTTLGVCTGEAQKQTPQLVSANLMAISLAQWLFVFWHMKFPELGRDTGMDNYPHHLRANLTRLETFRVGDTK